MIRVQNSSEQEFGEEYNETHVMAVGQMSNWRWAGFSVGLWVAGLFAGWHFIKFTSGVPELSFMAVGAVLVSPIAAFSGGLMEYCLARATLVAELEASSDG